MGLMDYRRNIIANSPHLMSASGAVASFSDGADLPLKSLVADINPIQDLSHGDPSPENICPISGWNGVKVTRIGKNLFNPHVYTGIAYNPTVGNTVTLTDSAVQFTDNGNGMFTVTTSATWRYFNIIIPIDPTKKYATKIIFNSTGQGGMTRGYLDADFKILTKFNSTDSAISWEYSLIPEVNASYYYFVFTNRGTASATLTITQPQFVEGTTIENYEPYNGLEVSIDLGQTVYGGTLNVLTGVLTVTHISDTQKLSAYNVVSTRTNTVHYRLFDSVFNTSLPKYQDSGNFSNVAKNVYNSSDTTHFYPNISNGRIELWLPIGTDTNTDVQIVCELATPYTIQLTPQQIRSLYGNNTIYADTGNTSLEYWAHP